MPAKVHAQETKENVYTQSYVSKSPFATDYPEKPKTFSKQSDVEMDSTSSLDFVIRQKEKELFELEQEMRLKDMSLKQVPHVQ